jgi:hypothetical protein
VSNYLLKQVKLPAARLGRAKNPDIKKGNPSNNEGLPFPGLIRWLNGFYIYSMRAFGSLFYVKRNLIAFVERPESF